MSLADLVEVYAVRSALAAVDWTASLSADLKRELDRVSEEIVAFEGAALFVADIAQAFAESPHIPAAFREAALEQLRSATANLGALFEQPGFASDGLFRQRLAIHRATPFDSAGAFALALLAARDQPGPVATVPTGLPPLEGLLTDVQLEVAVHALQLSSMARVNRLLDGIQQVIQQGTGTDAAATSPQSKLVQMAATAAEKDLLGALKSKHEPMDFLNTLVLWTLARGYEAVQRMRCSPQLTFFVANTSTELLLYEIAAYLLGSAWARVKIDSSRAGSEQIARSPAQERIASAVHVLGSFFEREGGLEMAERLFLPHSVGYLVNDEGGHALAMFCERLQDNVTRITLASPASGYRSKGTILERTEPLRRKVEGALGPDFVEAFAAIAAMLARGEVPTS